MIFIKPLPPASTSYYTIFIFGYIKTYLRECAAHGMAQALFVQVMPIRSVAKKTSHDQKVTALFVFWCG